MHDAIGRILLRLARSRGSSLLISWVMSNMSFVLPVERLHETETLMAFHHPHPSHAVHILLVPKRPYRSLMDVPPEGSDFLQDLLEAVQQLVREYELEHRGYRLIANGGDCQEVPHLHFHLVAD